MFVTLLTGLLLLGVAAAFGTRSLSFGRIEGAKRMRSILMYGFGPSEAVVDAAGPRPALNGLAELVGAALSGRFSGIDPAKVRRDLLAAGLYRTTPEAYLGYRAIAMTVTTGFLTLIVAVSPSMLGFVALAFGGTLAWRLPNVIVQRRAAARTAEIDRELPDLIDLLVVSVEAGVGLAGALQMMSSRMHGPLGAELRLMQQEQSMGLSSDQSLAKLLERCDTPSVRSFVRSLQQAERLGVSIGMILRNLADDMRTRRRQLAEERAQKAPVKILFPLIFLIFPSMFIVLLGPAVFSLRNAFG